MLKVLELNPVLVLGGTGMVTIGISDALKKNGDKCIILYGRQSNLKLKETYRVEKNTELYFNAFKGRLFDSDGFENKKNTFRVIEIIEKYKPDIIQLHNLHGYFINVELLFQYLVELNKPVFWTLHDCWTFTGHCAYFDYVMCDKWKNGCHNCPQKKSYPSSILLDNSKRNYKTKKEIFTSIQNLTIITPSYWLAGLVQESYLKKYQVEVIYNGVDLNVFKPTQSTFRKDYNCENKTIVLGVAGIWSKRKGLETFVRLVNELPEDKFQVVVVGLTKKQIKHMPKKMITIERTESVTELAEIYSAADIFVNPTLEDNFPTTNLEALACSTPVITYNTGGSPECINSSCGLILEKNDYSSLLNSILTFKQMKYNKEDILKQAYLFNKDNCYKKYIELYNRTN